MARPYGVPWLLTGPAAILTILTLVAWCMGFTQSSGQGSGLSAIRCGYSQYTQATSAMAGIGAFEYAKHLGYGCGTDGAFDHSSSRCSYPEVAGGEGSEGCCLASLRCQDAEELRQAEERIQFGFGQDREIPGGDDGGRWGCGGSCPGARSTGRRGFGTSGYRASTGHGMGRHRCWQWRGGDRVFASALRVTQNAHPDSVLRRDLAAALRTPERGGRAIPRTPLPSEALQKPAGAPSAMIDAAALPRFGARPAEPQYTTGPLKDPYMPSPGYPLGTSASPGPPLSMFSTTGLVAGAQAVPLCPRPAEAKDDLASRRNQFLLVLEPYRMAVWVQAMRPLRKLWAKPHSAISRCFPSRGWRGDFVAWLCGYCWKQTDRHFGGRRRGQSGGHVIFAFESEERGLLGRRDGELGGSCASRASLGKLGAANISSR